MCCCVVLVLVGVVVLLFHLFLDWLQRTISALKIDTDCATLRLLVVEIKQSSTLTVEAAKDQHFVEVWLNTAETIV